MSEQNPKNKADELYQRAYGPPRPKPTAPMSPGHRALLVLTVVAVLAVTGYTILQIPSMPEEIPVHFGFDGTVNRYGSPMTALWLALLMIVLTLATAWFSSKPHWMNYPFPVTEDNAPRLYLIGQQMMVHMAATLAVITVGIMSSWLDWPLFWLVSTGVIAMLVLVAVDIVRLFRAR